MLELNEEYRAQHRHLQREHKQANHPKTTQRESTPPESSVATSNTHHNRRADQEQARKGSSAHHPRKAPATSRSPPRLQHDATRDGTEQAAGTEISKGRHHHERMLESVERGTGNQSEEGATVQRLEGGRKGAGATRKGNTTAQESNDVVFVLRKLYTGGGLDAQQQSWDCMPTNLFNTLTLQLGTLSKVRL